ncbi:hypothetical protein FRB95_010189, partial [Tulasnella sp. JGI-2019a]
GCFAKPGENAFQLVDSSALITGTELLHWMIEHTDPKALIRVILDVCNCGNFLRLPWCFDYSGNLIPSDKPALSNKTAKIICVSACHEDEFAHFVKDHEGSYGGLLWYLVEGIRNQGSFPLRLIQAELTKHLSNSANNGWTQRPLVSTSHEAPNEALRL